MSRTPSPRWLVAAVPVGIVASGLLVWQASYAAFTATTENDGNTFAAGTVVLTDDDSDTALFTASGLVPGSTGFDCVDVTYSGSSAANVEFYATYVGADSELAQYLDFTVQEVTAGACAATGGEVGPALYSGGTLANLVATNGTYDNGLGTWAPSGPPAQTRAYRFTYTLQDNNAAQGDTTEVDLTWEARNT